MIKGILGKKLGMSQIFNEQGEMIPVTLIQAGPCFVMQKKLKDRDGYEAIQLGFDPKKQQRVNSPLKGHQDKAGKGYFYNLREMKCDDLESLEVGQEIKVSDIFEKGEIIKISGISKGKGFAGVTKRHNFGGLPGSHGSKIHRATGSIGCSADPSRVVRGKRMPGHMGNRKVTVKGLEVVEVKAEENLIAVKGAVPGAKGQVIVLKKQEV